MKDNLLDIHNMRERIKQLSDELEAIQERIDHDKVMDKFTHIKNEIANALTHGVGALFFIVAIPILLAYAIHAGAPKGYVVAAGIFGFGVLMVYLSSTIYHSIQHTFVKRVMRIVDHISIFILIAASYTPIVAYYLDKKTATILLVTIWLFAFLGSIYKLYFTGKFRLFSTIIYLTMGFLVLFVVKPLHDHLPGDTFYLLLIGGVSYVLGVVFFLWRSLNYSHAIWHVFVLGGSVTHYFLVFKAIPIL